MTKQDKEKLKSNITNNDYFGNKATVLNCMMTDMKNNKTGNTYIKFLKLFKKELVYLQKNYILKIK